MRFSVSSLFTLAAAATAVVAQPSKRASSLLNPPESYVHEVKWEELPAVSTEPVTNAKRFAQGLPPLNPRRRNPNRRVHGGAAHARKGTRVATAPRAETSSVPPTVTQCNILVKDMSSGQSLGYISPEWNRYAEYGALQPDQVNAFIVQLAYTPDATKQLDLLAVNGKSSAYPYFGASVGFSSDDSSIGKGDTDYLVLTGNTQTPPGSTPSYDASNSFTEVSSIPTTSESAIWSYDPATNALTAWWVNEDESSTNASILWTSDGVSPMFALTGDASEFRGLFGDAPEVSFTCVPSRGQSH